MIERLQPGLRAFRRDAIFQPGVQLHPPEAAAIDLQPRGSQLRLHRDRCVDLRRVSEVHAREPCLHHSDHLEGIVVDLHRLADDRGIACEARLPVPVREHGVRRSAQRAIVVGREEAPQGRLHTQQRKERARDEFAVDLFRRAREADAHGREHAAEHAVEDLIAVAEVLVHRVRQFGAVAHPTAIALGVGCGDLHERLGPIDRELRRMTWSTSVNTAVFAAMPTLIEMTATAVNSGAFRRLRIA